MTFAEILQEASSLIRFHTKNDRNVWFRGQENAEWPIKSSLHRHVEDMLKPWEAMQQAGQSISDVQKEAILRGEYTTLYHQFTADAWSMLDARERSPWGIVFAMQHYGLPTRLLDWTESFACAVYFAQSGRKKGDAAAIWALVPQAINLASMRNGRLMALREKCKLPKVETPETMPEVIQALLHPLYAIPDKNAGYPPTIAVLPFLSNPRMLAQRSVFTMMGDSFLPLEQQFDGELMRVRHLIKFTLDADSYDDVQAFIDLGAGDFGYYPDYEGLRRKAQTRKKRLIDNFSIS